MKVAELINEGLRGYKRSDFAKGITAHISYDDLGKLYLELGLGVGMPILPPAHTFEMQTPNGAVRVTSVKALRVKSVMQAGVTLTFENNLFHAGVKKEEDVFEKSFMGELKSL